MTDLHTECLQSLCRVCGNKLKKSKDQWKSNYRCEDYREMLREKFDLETEKDDASIHPLRFCNACYLSTSKTRASLVWEPHGEESCKTCSHGMKLKKGGRSPKKGFGGRKTPKQNESASAAIETERSSMNKQELLEKISDISARPSVNRSETFQENFDFVGGVKDDFNCAICREILSSPIETKCEHYFCAGCLRQVVGRAGATVPCPVCKEPILPTDLKQPTRMVLRLLGDLEVKCKLCNNKCHYENCGKHIYPTGEQPMPAPIPQQPQPEPTLPLIPPREGTLEQAMIDLRGGKISPEVEKLGTLYVKSKLKASNDGSAILKTGGKVSQLKLLLPFVY